MLTESELDLYFRSLPRDLVLVVEGSEYPVNKTLFSTFSRVINSMILPQPDITRLELNLSDPKHVFSVIVGFLHREKIEITYENDHFLLLIAKELGIDVIIPLIEQSLQDPNSIHNIIPRLEINNDESLIDFASGHILELMNNKKLYELPESVLSSLYHKSKSNFHSPDDQYTFLFSCLVKHPDSIETFMNDDEITSLDSRQLLKMIQNPDFKALQGKIPTFKIAKSLLAKISQFKSQINLKRRQAQLTAQKIDEESEEMIILQKEIEKLKEILNKVKLLKDQIFKNISNIATDEFVENGIMLQDRYMPEDLLADIHNKLNSLLQRSDEFAKCVHDAPSTNVFFKNSFRRFDDHAREFQKRVKNMLEICSNLNPNDVAVRHVISLFSKIHHDLIQIEIDIKNEIVP